MSAALISAAQNPELVKSATDMVKTTQSNAMKVLKVVGIAVGVGLATFIVVKVVKKIKSKLKEKEKIDKDTANFDKNKCKLEPTQHLAIANALANAFDLDSMTQTFQNYKEDTIKAQLSKIPTIDDWKAVIVEYGTRKQRWDGENHTLIEQLQLEPDQSDREEWQKILDKIGATGLL